MQNIINKITLYDIVSTIVPGIMIFIGVCSIIPTEIKRLISEINNEWFVFGLVIVFSYCVGWMLSQMIKYIYRFFEKKININCLYLVVYIITAIAFIFKIDNIKLVFSMTVWIVFILLTGKVKKRNDTIEYKILIKKCYKYLVELYEDFDKNFDLKNENDLKKAVESMSTSSYMLIQTNEKYNRVHNYNSSKSFSKNLSGVSLFLAFIFNYHLFTNAGGLKFDIIYSVAIVICVSGYFVLKNRYLMFADKLKILVLTYFLDFLENKQHDDKKQNNTEGRKN